VNLKFLILLQNYYFYNRETRESANIEKETANIEQKTVKPISDSNLDGVSGNGVNLNLTL